MMPQVMMDGYEVKVKELLVWSRFVCNFYAVTLEKIILPCICCLCLNLCSIIEKLLVSVVSMQNKKSIVK